MRNLILYSLLFISVSVVKTTAQVYFPTCKDLIITSMDHSHDNDTLIVTVENSCDNCGVHAYTGLIITSLEDTLAKDVLLGSNFSPENEDSYIYYLLTNNSRVDFSESFKVEMSGVCDSIPLSPDLMLNVKESIWDKKKLIIQNNHLLMPDPDQSIKNVSIYNLSGQLALKETAVNTSFYDLKVAEPGVYLVSVTLSSGEEVNLKYVNY